MRSSFSVIDSAGQRSYLCPDGSLSPRPCTPTENIPHRAVPKAAPGVRPGGPWLPPGFRFPEELPRPSYDLYPGFPTLGQAGVPAIDAIARAEEKVARARAVASRIAANFDRLRALMGEVKTAEMLEETTQYLDRAIQELEEVRVRFVARGAV